MSNIKLILLFISSVLAAFVLAKIAVNYANQFGLISDPNHRSSHSDVIPHGGGISFVIVFISSLLYLSFTISISESLLYSLLIGGGLVATIGLYDDIKVLRARYRFVMQIILLAIGYYFVIDGEMLVSSFESKAFQWFLHLFFVLLMAWWLNLFNFMDGTDGFASIEAISILICASILIGVNTNTLFMHWYDIQFLMLILGASVAGFLFFNWPPAKIFMGDVGSTFLGYTIAIIALQTVVIGELNIWVWMILGGVFWVDATITLLTRMITGQKWYLAHHSHAYQKATRYWVGKYSISRTRSHSVLAFLTLFVNISWLFPLAWIALIHPNWGPVIVVFAWLPIVFWVISQKAGIIDKK